MRVINIKGMGWSRLVTLTSIILLSSVSFAQPSDAAILSRLKSQTTNPKLISIELYGRRGSASRVVENGITITTFYRSYRAKMKTDYPGITRIYRSMVKYSTASGSWAFAQDLVGEESYEGISNPSWSEIEPILLADVKQLVGSSTYGNIVGEITELKLDSKPEWHWHSMSSVEFYVTTTYSEKVSYTELEKVKKRFSVRLYADEYKAPWAASFIIGQVTKESLGKAVYSSDELKAMRTLKQVDIEARTNAEIANLPEVTIPFYTNHAELMVHFHQLLMTADGPTLEAYLRKMLTTGYFDPQMTTVLNDRGANLINDVIKRSVGYRQQYCSSPLLKHTQSNMIEWYNKDASTSSRIASVDGGNGVRGISEISISASDAGSDRGKALANTSCKVRANPITRMKAKTLNSANGQLVFSQYGSSEWSYIGRIVSKSGSGYKITWMDGSSSVESKSSICNYELLEGDLVYTKNSSGVIVSRWITKNTGTTVVEVEDLNGRVSSIHIKDLRFK